MYQIAKLTFMLLLGMGISQCGSEKQALPATGTTNSTYNTNSGSSSFDSTSLSSDVQAGFGDTSTSSTTIPTVSDQTTSTATSTTNYDPSIYDTSSTTDAGGGLFDIAKGIFANDSSSSDSSGGLLSNVFGNSGGSSPNYTAGQPVRNVIRGIGGLFGNLFR